jgi:uncharacterized membrane protein
MQSKNSMPALNGQKKFVLAVLWVTSAAICLSGAFYSVYSAVLGISFPILNVQIPGFVFGIAVLYLGIRYMLMVLRLRKELRRTFSQFSWGNFKKEKRPR